jgi:hypothetical protein
MSKWVGPFLTVRQDGAHVHGFKPTVHGNGCNVNGANATVYGDRCTVTGSNATVYGNDCVVTGTNSRAIGHRNTVKGANVYASGDYNHVSGENAKAIGKGNIVNVKQPVVVDTTARKRPRSSTRDRRAVKKSISAPKKKNKKKKEEDKFVQGPTPNELEHDKEASGTEEEKGACVVCLTNRTICITAPCRHLCVCVKCARTLVFGEDGEDIKKRGTVKCPMCREDIKSVLRVH